MTGVLWSYRRTTCFGNPCSAMAVSSLTRRQFVGTSLVAPFLAAARPTSQAVAEPHDDGAAYRLYWGDLHNHNAAGYAAGSLERSIEIARERPDFFAFTGHASRHDVPTMPGNRHQKWIDGFEVHSRHWPRTRQLMRDANSDRFVALLGGDAALTLDMRKPAKQRETTDLRHLQQDNTISLTGRSRPKAICCSGWSAQAIARQHCAGTMRAPGATNPKVAVFVSSNTTTKWPGRARYGWWVRRAKRYRAHCLPW